METKTLRHRWRPRHNDGSRRILDHGACVVWNVSPLLLAVYLLMCMKPDGCGRLDKFGGIERLTLAIGMRFANVCPFLHRRAVVVPFFIMHGSPNVAACFFHVSER